MDPVITRERLALRCDTIERAYEFMLAYAAQGLSGDAGSQSGGELRQQLSKSAAALREIAAEYGALVEAEQLTPRPPFDAFVAVLQRDSASAVAAIELVLAQPSISSQLVDNLNASIHVRAVLTDLFLIDEVLKSRPVEIEPTGNR